MGHVYLARFRGAEGFEKRLVIKRLRPELERNQRFMTMFFQEAHSQVSLSHKNLVSIFDFGRVGNAYFIAMEYVAGCALAALFQSTRERNESVPLHVVVYIGIELCRGLSYMHRQGLVHRDVTPRNVLLSQEGEVKLSDFGVALSADRASPIRGTIAYMAPEQARGEATDGRADVYAVGLLLAEAVTGSRIRKSSHPEEGLIEARGSAEVQVDGPLSAVVARATARDVGARYADVDEMLTALEEIARTLPTTTTSERELARLVSEIGRVQIEESVPLEEATVTGVATYFRDAKTEATFLEEVLRPPQQSRARWIVPILLVAIGTGLFVRRGIAPAPTSTPAVTPTAPDPLPRPIVPSKVDAVPKETDVPRPNVRAESTGTLIIQCTPWCVPYVDGRMEGPDAREHRIVVSAGTHRVTVHRLEDELTQLTNIKPHGSQTIEFTFK